MLLKEDSISVSFLQNPPRFLFFTGKGGVGKTSLSCASAVALKEEPPAEVKASVQALVGCVAGAVKIEETVEMMKAAGLVDVTFLDKPYNIDAMDNCNDALYKTVRELLGQGKKLSDYVSSVDFAGKKA